MTTRDATGRSYWPRPRVPDVAPHRDVVSSPLPVSETLAGKKLIIVGGTGFLGKVLVSLLLKRFPDIAHIYLMVRPREGLTPDERFMQEQWPSPCYDPIKEGKNEFEAKFWLDGHLTPIAGDVTKRFGGIDEKTLKELKKEGIDAVLNVAGVVSFTPPIDEAFQVNTLGVTNLVDLCKELAGLGPDDDPAGAVPLLHTSTCFVAGERTGVVHEEDPRINPFPRSDKLDRSLWDPRRELDEGMETARRIRARENDAQLQSEVRERAIAKLRSKSQPTSGDVLEQAIKKEMRRTIDKELIAAGADRAEHWGWPNVYTYTKSVGEQLLAGSGVPYTIVRPAVVESALEFPVPGWNEGINTSAPLIYMALHGTVNYPTRDGNILDVIPVDEVCYGTVLSTAALLRGEQDAVYQYGTSDANGLTMNRLIELTGLYKRRFMRSRNRGNPLLNRLYARVEPVPITPEGYKARSTPAFRKALKSAQAGIDALKKTPVGSVVAPMKSTLAGIDRQLAGAEMVMGAFLPFTSQLDYRFRCDNTRALAKRCVDEDKAKVPFGPENLDWRAYWQEIHIKGLRKWVFPHLEARLAKRPRAEERFSDLLALLDEVADREGNRVALQRLVSSPEGEGEGEGSPALESVSYKDLRRAAHRCAARLADSGIHPGDRVALIGPNDPTWAVGFFGILNAGAVVVPLDAKLDGETLWRRMKETEANVALVSASYEDEVGEAACLDLDEFAEIPARYDVVEPPEVLVSPDDLAIVAYTSGTTGPARAVQLTHKNVTTGLAGVAPLFKLSRRDSGLSVLPLHHSFELTCGLLLPLLRGARVTYVDEVTADRLTEAFQVAGITAMIGVPQVWEDLEERIADDLRDSGPFAEAAFQAGVLLNKTLGKALGVNLGRVIFRPVHERLGGRIRFLISTGGNVPKKTADTFKSLGIELKQGYGLTEGAPVLTVGDAGKGGRSVPGIEVEVRNVQDDGIGEIVARGEALSGDVLTDDDDNSPLGADGWLETGDLGRIDKHGRITVVARNNEVITTRDGDRVFPRPIEEALEAQSDIDEAAVVGVPDGQGGERVAALVVAERSSKAGLSAARRSAEGVVRKLDRKERPDILEITGEVLPRTADRKIKRTEVIARVVSAQSARAIAAEANAVLEAAEVQVPGEQRLAPRRERLSAPGRAAPAKGGEGSSVTLPKEVRSWAKRGLLEGQMGFYRKAMKANVEGRQHIPYNRQTIVAANHASHLDMGLIKYGLGSYGRDIVTLAAKDYFFEGKWRRTYFENLTNLRPFDRGDSPRDAMREASGLLEAGHNVLIFPEGTRTSTGELAPFRPAVTYLAMKHQIDILPVYVDGTHRSMPKGAFVPKNRRVGVHVGPVISVAKLQAAADEAGLRMSAACAKAAQVVQRAVEALRDEKTFVLEDAIDELILGKKVEGKVDKHPLATLFEELETRFVADEVKEPATFYFSLGAGPETKWTVQIAKDGCNIVNGKLDAPADCVMKTNVALFTKIVREHYIPQMNEFMDGTVKTNAPDLLMTFVSVFNL